MEDDSAAAGREAIVRLGRSEKARREERKKSGPIC